jgi:hypothetical protein
MVVVPIIAILFQDTTCAAPSATAASVTAARWT